MGGIAVVVMILAGAPVGMAAVSVGSAWVSGGGGERQKKEQQDEYGEYSFLFHGGIYYVF